jgi:hypothetical protein
LAASELSEDNPDGRKMSIVIFVLDLNGNRSKFAVDISIYKDEDQLKELERKKKQQERETAKQEKKQKV